MKKALSMFLVLSLCLALLAVPALAEGTYTPGTYTASATGHEEGVTVTVTVDESSITEVSIDVSNETPAIGGMAGEALTAQVLEAQGAEIDGVSGASETSAAVRRAVAEALAQAKGSDGTGEKTAVADGTYSGTAPSFGLLSQMTCEVTFENGAIKDVKVTEESDSQTGEWFASAEELLIPRILDAQSLEVDAITGATSSSNGIKNCIAKAIDAAGGNADEWYTPIEKKDDTVVIDGYDVVVVGLGGSGVLSYCAAADQGASVFGFDAAGKIGGNSVCTYGPMALNSEYLKDLFNEGQDYINPDEVYDTWIEYVESEDKADIIYEAVYSSGKALDYYVENFGFEFTGLGLLGSFVVPSWDKEWCVYTPDPETGWNVLGPNKTYQFLRAMDLATSKNEKNQYMTELTGEKLLFDDGNVIGVQAKYYDGTTYEIYGKTVILATGGFLGNHEMMMEVYGSDLNAMGDTVNKGAGIKMGQSAGGATYMLHTLPMVHISQVANIIRTDDLTPDQKAILSALALTTDMPMVTTGGEVWGNANQSGTQDAAVSVEIVFAPDFMYYNIYTQDDIDNIRTKGLSEAQSQATSAFLSQGGTLPEPGTPVEDIDTILEVGAKFNDVLIAGSIAELAEKIGCDAAVLGETLGGVETTYYAVPVTSWSYGTVGGLDVDVNMNVLREDGSPITNLYAVGQDSEGVCNIDGKAYTPWGGQAQSWTFVSGKIAGTAAATVAMNG